MKNAIKYGLLIGVLTGIWILIMHFMGVYHQDKRGPFNIHWMEYISVFIPFTGLYLGIKSYRDNLNGGRLEFFEGIMEGFKILVVGFVLYVAISAVYLQYAGAAILKLDYMQRVGGAGIVGIVFNLIISLILMNKQRNL